MRITLASRHMLDTLKAVVAVSDAQIHLIKAPFTPTPSAVVADFDEADFVGYAAAEVAPTAGVAWDDDFLNAVISFNSAHFQPTSGATPNTIYGYYVTATVLDTVVNELVDVFVFDTPVPLLSAADALDVVYLMKLGPPME